MCTSVSVVPGLCRFTAFLGILIGFRLLLLIYVRLLSVVLPPRRGPARRAHSPSLEALMEPITGALIAGGASLLGNIFSSDTSAQNTAANIAAQEQMQSQTQAFNAQQAQLGRDFNQSMFNQQVGLANSAYQRSAADMKRAGLNPMMMFGSGAAAGTPGGAGAPTAAVGTPNMALSNRMSALGNLGDVVGRAISSANAVNDFNYRAAQTDYTKQMTETEKQNTLDAANRASASGLALPARRVEAAEAENKLKDADAIAVQKYDYKYGAAGRLIKPVMSGIGDVSSGLTRAVTNLINDLSGPSGQSLYDKARGAVGRPGTVVDLKDFPTLMKNAASKEPKAPLPFYSDAPRNFDERFGKY